MNKPGKYDDLCTIVRESAEAETAIVIVLNGKQGHGFSLQTTVPTEKSRIADCLIEVAQQIKNSI